MVGNFHKRILALFIMTAVLLSSIQNIQVVYASTEKKIYESNQKNTDLMDYKGYIAEHQDGLKEWFEKKQANEILISSSAVVMEQSEEVTITGSSSFTDENGYITYDVDVLNGGFYNIEVKYYPTKGKGAPIIRSLYLNGQIPFREASNLVFERIWADKEKDFLMKSDKNYAFPSQVEKPDWKTKYLEDNNGYYNEPFVFYFQPGKNQITLNSIQEPMEIEYIKLISAEPSITYEEYLEAHVAEGAKIITSDYLQDTGIMIQGEDAYWKSNASLIPVNDRTSVKTLPYHASNIVMNTIGGDNWSTPGDAISWKVEVPEDGLYKMAIRFKQIANRDFYSIRKLTINNEVPFEEAAKLKFDYKSKFQLAYLGEEEDYYFYFNKGVNEIALSVSLGDLGPYIREVEESVLKLNDLYRRIITITGTNPDKYRDYQLTLLIPELVSILEQERDRLTSVVNGIGESKGQKTSEISAMLIQINGFIDKPNKIATGLSTFNANISALSNWCLSLGSQPLLIDYLLISPDDHKLEKAEGNFFQNLIHNILAFFGSFINDYAVNDSENSKEAKAVEVWIATSRDQYNIVQRMANETFAGKDYEVKLKMVGADTIMPATLTGNGPDVAIQINSTMPTNFAFRNAAYDLSQFDDFDEIYQQFPEATMEYFLYQDGYYGLPDQMSFPVMFYREDILSELGLDVPNTWDEFLSLIPYLQANNMDMFLEATTSMASLGATTSMSSTKAISSVFMSLLYQNGEALYRDSGLHTGLDTDNALQVFKLWTEYYTKHNFSVTIDFLTRFRTGSVPIAVVDFVNFNTLKASAPEIDGLWSIAPIPGTVKEDGSIDRSTSSIVGASMIIKNTVEEKNTIDEAWEVLKWWTDADTQVQYASELEAILGAAARYPVANLDAINRLAWSQEEKAVLNEVIQWLKGIPQVPGGYISGRYIENAFLKVVNENLNPIDTIYYMLEYINQELYNKHNEFGLIQN